MTETFLILLAGGILLAAAVSDPQAVTLQWLRLCGILSLALGALAGFFLLRREHLPQIPPFFRAVEWGQWAAAMAAILLQLAFVQVAFRRTQRSLAFLAFLIAVSAATAFVHEQIAPSAWPKPIAVAVQFLACAGVAAMTGLVLMDMLLGHAYLTASKMTIAPFKRLNNALIVSLLLRATTAVALVLFLQSQKPFNMLWGLYGLHIGTRYFVGLIIPAIFTLMARACINLRSTQSATGILYVNGLMVFIGELVALYLLRETGLPF